MPSQAWDIMEPAALARTTPSLSVLGPAVASGAAVVSQFWQCFSGEGLAVKFLARH